MKFTDYSNKNAGHFGWNVSGKINLTFANGRPVRKEGSSWKKGISERKIPTPLTHLNMNYSLSLRRPQKWNTYLKGKYHLEFRVQLGNFTVTFIDDRCALFIAPVHISVRRVWQLTCAKNSSCSMATARDRQDCPPQLSKLYVKSCCVSSSFV